MLVPGWKMAKKYQKKGKKKFQKKVKKSTRKRAKKKKTRKISENGERWCLVGEEQSKRSYTAVDKLLASILEKNLIFGLIDPDHF